MTRPSKLWCAGVVAACLAVHTTTAQRASDADTALMAAVRAARSPVEPRQCSLEGEGGRLITDVARQAQFTILGEAHGVDAVPRFASALFCDLARSGYRHLAIEVSPPLGVQLERRARSPKPLDAIMRFGERFYPGPPFYMLHEEAQLLADAVASVGPRMSTIWGLDYDVAPEGLVLHRLAELAPARARRAVSNLRDKAESMYAGALAEKNPAKVFSFAGPDSLVAAARRDMSPVKGSEGDQLLTLLETTLQINHEWIAGRGYSSNLMRSDNLRRNFVAHYNAAVRSGELRPRVMVKLGASHAYRGRSLVNTFDVGSLLPEMAAAGGMSSVGILLVGGNGAQQALFDVRTFSYSPSSNVYSGTPWIRAFFAVADSTRWSVFDLRKLRELANARALGALSASALQAIFGFDFLVILGGSAPSTPFPLRRPAWANLR